MRQEKGRDQVAVPLLLPRGMHMALYWSIELILKLHHMQIDLLHPPPKSRFLYKLQADITWITYPTRTQKDP